MCCAKGIYYQISFFRLLQEVLHTICQSSGQVLRIVIFKKNGVQAMVEYPLILFIYHNLLFAYFYMPSRDMNHL